jgi:hypothetical protein
MTSQQKNNKKGCLKILRQPFFIKQASSLQDIFALVGVFHQQVFQQVSIKYNLYLTDEKLQ